MRIKLKNTARMFGAIVLAFVLAACALAGCRESEPPPADEANIAVSISLDTDAVKKQFFVNDAFTSDGLKVTVKMSDGTSEISTDFSVSEPDMTTVGKKTVTVTCAQKTSSYDITVSEVAISELALDIQQVKTSFEAGSDFNYAGLKVTAIYSDGSTSELNLRDCSVSKPNMQETGEKTVTVNYQGKSASYKIVIAEPEVLSITLDTSAVKTRFDEGDEFDHTGLKVIAHLSNNAERELATGEYSVVTPDMSAGTRSVTVEYGDKTAEYTITVIQSSVVITLDTENVRKSYDIDDAVSVDGLTVTATTKDGDKTAVALSDCEVVLPDTTTAGRKAVLVKYLNAVAGFSVFVNPNETTEYVFEAESAKLPDDATVESGVVTASGNKCVGNLEAAGSVVTFELISGKATTATFGVSLNRPDPFTFEDAFILAVNGVQATVGEVTEGFWGKIPDGGNYYLFGEFIETEITLVEGKNTITLTVGNNIRTVSGLPFTNLDCIRILSDGYLAWYETDNVFEAEDAVLPETAVVKTDEDAAKYASGGKYVGGLTTRGDKVVFNVTALYSGKAVLKISINRADPLVFENIFTVKVNGIVYTIGELEDGFWPKGGNDCNFGEYAEVEIELVAGENVIEFTVGENPNAASGVCLSNFDNIIITTEVPVEWTEKEDRS